jgi:hypothetical protein
MWKGGAMKNVWIKPEIRKAEFVADMDCACSCGFFSGSGSGHGRTGG